MLDVFRHDEAAFAELDALLRAPSLYDQFLRYLARRGLPVPAACLERDFAEPYVRNPELVPVFKTIYEDTSRGGTPTRCARSSSTSRRASSSGGSVT